MLDDVAEAIAATAGKDCPAWWWWHPAGNDRRRPGNCDHWSRCCRAAAVVCDVGRCSSVDVWPAKGRCCQAVHRPATAVHSRGGSASAEKQSSAVEVGPAGSTVAGNSPVPSVRSPSLLWKIRKNSTGTGMIENTENKRHCLQNEKKNILPFFFWRRIRKEKRKFS